MVLSGVSAGLSVMGGAQGPFMLVWAIMVLLLAAGMASLIDCHWFAVRRWRRWARIRNVLLSSDPQQRMILTRYLVGMLNCMAGVLALNYGVTMGIVDAAACHALSLAAISGGVACGVVLRAGWNKRLNDPSMAEFQVMAVIVFLGWGYLIGGQGKPVALMLLFVTLLFCMFTVNTRQLARCCIMAALVFGAAFTTVALQSPTEPFTQTMQKIYFGVLVIILMSMCLMATQVNKLRLRSAQRKKELAEALARIRELAIRDELTGLFNRRHMLELLNTERVRAARSGSSWCVCLLDLDHFKLINDRHGHGVGDEVLCAMALVIQDGLRGSDQVARWGGEEFLLMFPDTPCDEASQVLQRIRQALSVAMISRTVPDLSITFSAGVTCFDGDEPLTQTIDRADQALYRAKAAGRNRTERVLVGSTKVERRLRLDGVR